MSKIMPNGLPAFLINDADLTLKQAQSFFMLFRLAAVSDVQPQGNQAVLSLAWDPTWFQRDRPLEAWMAHEDDAVDLVVILQSNEKRAGAMYLMEDASINTVNLSGAQASLIGKLTHYPMTDEGTGEIGQLLKLYAERNKTLMDVLAAPASTH